MVITEDGIRLGIYNLRATTGQVPFLVGVGPSNRAQVGQVIAGLPVVESPYPMEEGHYLFMGVIVSDPWRACAELGME